MKLIDWKIRSNGVLDGPSIHDSYIIGLTYCDPDYIEIMFEKGQENFYMRMDQIYDLGIAIERSPICSTIFAWRAIESPEVDFNMPDNVWRILYPEEDQVGSLERRRRIVESHPEALLINILCSYGGNMSFACESLKFYQK